VESTPELADLEIPRLRLDLRNPRLPVVPDSQRDALGEMSEVQRQKLVALARHIARHGLNPTQRFIVIPDDGSQFIVLDGNRRLTALRVLENPDVALSRLSEPELRQVKQIAAAYVPIEDVPCAVFKSREEADVWIELIHEGESDGAGSVPWTNQQKARHKARAGTKPPHLQVLEFVHSEGRLSTEATQVIERGRYPLTTLERALSTPYVRERLGIDFADGQVVTRYPKSEVLKGLSKIVDEIGTGTVKVKHFMSVADRMAYVDTFANAALPVTDTMEESAVTLTSAADKPKPARGASKDRKQSGERARLIPSSFAVAIPAPRINDIYHELKRKLRVDDVPNATGALLRVFLELSVDDYLERKALGVSEEKSLAEKLEAAAKQIDSTGALSNKALIPVRASGPGGALSTTLNALMHGRQMTVSGADLKALWSRLEPFFQALWA
jgi:hypothetical protein